MTNSGGIVSLSPTRSRKQNERVEENTLDSLSLIAAQLTLPLLCFQIADIWSAQERGLATALFALAPFLGVSSPSSRTNDGDEDLADLFDFFLNPFQPVLGPIVGGFTAPTGWR